MIEGIIEAALASAPPELKSALKKVDDFMPMVNMFHASIPLEKEKGELGVSYLIRFENSGIILYQVALASKPEINNGKPFVSRQLNKWDVSAKIKDLTASL